MKKRLIGALAPAIAAAMIAWIAATPALSQTPKPASTSDYPADVDKQSGFRLPLPKREDLDEADQKLYDAATSGESIAGLHGPGGLRLYSLKTAPHLMAILSYLRHDAAIPPKVSEVAILCVARATDNKFEWAAHEVLARKAGVLEPTIAAIKNRASTAGLPETDALVIALGRETFERNHVTPETFAAAKQTFGANKLVDIVLLMGDYSRTAALLTAFDMQLKPGDVSDLPVP
jgi:4-carboxymuconolactone decarboxylase